MTFLVKDTNNANYKDITSYLKYFEKVDEIENHMRLDHFSFEQFKCKVG